MPRAAAKFLTGRQLWHWIVLAAGLPGWRRAKRVGAKTPATAAGVIAPTRSAQRQAVAEHRPAARNRQSPHVP